MSDDFTNPGAGGSWDSRYGWSPTWPPSEPQYWGAPVGPGEPGPERSRHGKTGSRSLKALAGIGIATLFIVASAGGAAIGHAVWPSTGTSNTASGSNTPPTYSFGGGQSSPFGNGSSGGSTDGLGGPSDVGAIAAKADQFLVDVNSTFQYQSAQGAGTGIVLTSNGEVVTNNHVIDGATKISVTDVGNGKTYDASVVGYDPSADIAVLQLKDASGLKTASFADSAHAAVGESVVAVGNAGGTGGTPSSSGGSITALDTSITANDELDGLAEHLSGLIQVNADVQPGDSGGALVDTSGRVLGVDTAASQGFSFGSQQAANAGYAIPAATVESVVHQIASGRTTASVHYGPTAFLGLLLSSGSSAGNGGYNLGGNGLGQVGGGSALSVSGVVTGGAAASVGIVAGDQIISLDGQSVTSNSSISSILLQLHPGQKVTIGWVDQSGQSHEGTATLTAGPPA